MGGYQSVQPGDCIVAFSRRDIYDIKQLIEQVGGRVVRQAGPWAGVVSWAPVLLCQRATGQQAPCNERCRAL